MKLATILKLLQKKYPVSRKNGFIGAILWVYDDGSGKICSSNPDQEELFGFSSLNQLEKHLKEK